VVELWYRSAGRRSTQLVFCDLGVHATRSGYCVYDDLVEKLRARGIPAAEIAAIGDADNAIRHGNRSDASKSVYVCCKLSKEQLWGQIRDEGAGFNPDDVPDCTGPENLELPSGRGIMLMRAFMSRVEYNDRGNRVVMGKYRAGDAA